MVGFRLSLCQAAPPSNWTALGPANSVRLRLDRLCGSGFPGTRWPLVFLTGPDLRVSMPELLAKCPYPDNFTWGCSAVGSAREWHSRGRRFNPGQLHQPSPKRKLPAIANATAGHKVQLRLASQPFEIPVQPCTSCSWTVASHDSLSDDAKHASITGVVHQLRAATPPHLLVLAPSSVAMLN
jgi:hypothetical protein